MRTILLLILSCARLPAADGDGFVPLFAKDGVPDGWVVRDWADVSKPAQGAPAWTVKDGTKAPPIKDRPRKGRIGFQNLSRDSGQVQIKGARIKVEE